MEFLNFIFQKSINMYNIFGTLVFMICFYLLINLLKSLLFTSNKYKTNSSKQLNCNCTSCKKRLVSYNRITLLAKFNKYFFIKIFLLIILTLWAIKLINVEIKEEKNEIDYKNFNPYKILGVNSSSEISEIKKSYRRLIVKKHPDKLISPGMNEDEIEKIRKEFIYIVKAYEILTDPEKKENFESYGDPDGPKGGLRYFVPFLFLKKEYHYPVIISFLIFILFLAIYAAISLRESGDHYDEVGNSLMSRGYYLYYLNENTMLKNIPFIAGLSTDFNYLIVRKDEHDKLDELWSMCCSYCPKIKEGDIPFENKKAIVLIYSWLSRIENLSLNLMNDTEFVTNKIMEIIPKFYFFANMMNEKKNYDKKGKTIGFHCLKSICEFSQCMHQRLWFDFSPYCQLPYINDDVIKSLNKKMKKEFMQYNEFLCSDKEKKTEFLNLIKSEVSKLKSSNNSGDNNELLDLDNSKIEEIIEVSSHLPTYEVSTEVLNSKNYFSIGETIEFNINISRKLEGRSLDDKEIGFLHCNSYNQDFKERAIYFIINDQEKYCFSEEVEFSKNNWNLTIKRKFIPTDVRDLKYF